MLDFGKQVQKLESLDWWKCFSRHQEFDGGAGRTLHQGNFYNADSGVSSGIAFYRVNAHG